MGPIKEEWPMEYLVEIGAEIVQPNWNLMKLDLTGASPFGEVEEHRPMLEPLQKNIYALI